MLECKIRCKDGFEIRRVKCRFCEKGDITRIVRPRSGVVDRLVCKSCDTFNTEDDVNIFDFTPEAAVLRKKYLEGEQ